MADKKVAKKSADKSNVTVADLRSKTAEELQKMLEDNKKDLLILQKSLAADELANPHAVRKMRREIARIKTVMTQVSKKDVVEESKSNNDKEGAK